jgi:hypothetical protein
MTTEYSARPSSFDSSADIFTVIVKPCQLLPGRQIIRRQPQRLLPGEHRLIDPAAVLERISKIQVRGGVIRPQRKGMFKGLDCLGLTPNDPSARRVIPKAVIDVQIEVKTRPWYALELVRSEMLDVDQVPECAKAVAAGRLGPLHVVEDECDTLDFHGCCSLMTITGRASLKC